MSLATTRPVGPDLLGQPARDAAVAGADLEAAPVSGDAELLEPEEHLRVEHPRHQRQALVLLGKRVGQHVAGHPNLPRLQRAPESTRRRARLSRPPRRREQHGSRTSTRCRLQSSRHARAPSRSAAGSAGGSAAAGRGGRRRTGRLQVRPAATGAGSAGPSGRRWRAAAGRRPGRSPPGRRCGSRGGSKKFSGSGRAQSMRKCRTQPSRPERDAARGLAGDEALLEPVGVGDRPAGRRRSAPAGARACRPGSGSTRSARASRRAWTGCGRGSPRPGSPKLEEGVERADDHEIEVDEEHRPLEVGEPRAPEPRLRPDALGAGRHRRRRAAAAARSAPPGRIPSGSVGEAGEG